MHKNFLKIAAVLGAVAVILGAFGAHALKVKVTADVLAIYETGVRYQFYHVFALLATAILYKDFNVKRLSLAGQCFIYGIALFCGSLYFLTYTKAAGLENLNFLGAITPFGGLLFIAGWLFLFAAIFKSGPGRV